MTFYNINNLEKVLIEISDIINTKIDNTSKDVYIVNSIIGLKDPTIKRHNKLFHFVQFLPNQNCYSHMEEETDGFIFKDISLEMIPRYNNSYNTQATEQIYYKAV